MKRNKKIVVKYSQKFFRFLEYYAGVKCCQFKRNIIANMAFESLKKYPEFNNYFDKECTLPVLYEFYNEIKTTDFISNFENKRKNQKERNQINLENRRLRKGSYSEFYRTEEWTELAKTVKKIYGRKCMKCACNKSIMHTDHIIPRSKDISLELEIHNLQVLCETCNLEKLNLNSIDYRTPEDLIKLKNYLDNKDIKPTIQSWINFNRKKLTIKQIDILIELWKTK